MALNYRIILAPSESVKKMLVRRMTIGGMASKEELKKSIVWGAALLVQGIIPEIFYAADVGSKVGNVYVGEVVGNCPQHVNTIVFIGNVSDVNQVFAALKNERVIG